MSTPSPNAPICDPRTGLITQAWLNYFITVDGSVSSFSSVTIVRNGVSQGVSLSVDAASLTGTTLAPGVVSSSLTGVGTLSSGSAGAGFTVKLGEVGLAGTLPWANLPAGAGSWVAQPTIIGMLTVNGGIRVLDDIQPQVTYRSNLGAINAKFLSIYGAELYVENLVAQDVMATIGGRVLVAPTTSLTADCAPAATTITVKHNNLHNGDRVRFENGGQVEWMAITSAASGSAGAYVYSVTRNLDGSGANQWYVGDAVLNTGTTGNGFIDLYSTAGVFSGTGPSIVGNVRTGTTYNQIAPRWAIGNLNGLYGYATDTYGAAFGDSTAANLTIDATNGLRIRTATTVYAQLSGSIFSIGDLAGTAYVKWDGSALTILSAGVTLDSSGLLLNQGSSAYDAHGALKFGRPAAYSFGQTGDINGLHSDNYGSDQILTLENTIKGTGAADGKAWVIIAANGWENTPSQVSTNPAEIVLKSQIGGSSAQIAADAVSFLNSSFGLGFTWLASDNSITNQGPITERGRSKPMGEWTAVTYASGNFTAGGAQTWTVQSGDQAAYAYTLVGKTMVLTAQIVTSTIGGTPNPELRIAVPGGFTIARAFTAPGFAIKNSASSTTHESLLISGSAGAAYLSLYLLGAPNWPATTDATNIYITVAFEVQ